MSKIADLAKQGVFYRPLSDSTAEQEKKPEQEQGNFSRGFEKAMLQVPQTLGGSAALIGDLAGSQGLKEYGLGVYQKNADKIQAITKDSDSLSNVLEGDASGADWLKNTAGYVAGQAIQAVATGGVGGFIGSQLAKRGISQVVARGANSLAAREVANKVAAQGAKWGAGTAMLGNNLAQEAGSIYPEALNVAAEEGRELTGMDKARVVGSAVAAAGVDTAMDALMMGRVLKGARKPGESLARAAIREVPGAMAREGVTEGIQTGIERFGAGQELDTASAIRDYVDSIGVGVVGGGMGGAASVIRANKVVPESGPLTRAANIATEQQVLQLENDPQPLIAFPDGSVGTKAAMEMYLLQFPEGDERDGKRRELMGRDPETGKRIKPEAPPEQEPPKFADTPEQEAQSLADWGAEHDPVPIEQAHALLAAPGTKGESLMVAPHPSGEGFTVVPSNWLTLDTQAKLGDLQKPVKTEAGEKKEAAPAPAAEAAPAATPEAPAEPEWKTNPYTAFKFKDRALAETFMVNRSADPALFEVKEVDGKFAVKRRAIPLSPTEGASNGSDNAVLAQEGTAARGSGDQLADVLGESAGGGNSAVAGAPEQRGTDGPAADGIAEPDPVHATGGTDSDPALTDDRFSDEVTDAYGGQTNHTLTMRGKDGKPVGTIEYTIYQGKPSISMIDVPEKHRRKGYGAELVTQMQKQFPDTEIEWGGMTDDGAKLRASLDMKEVPSEHAGKFKRLETALAERDALLARAEEFQSIENPSDEQREAYFDDMMPLNYLHDEIDEIESDLYGARPTKQIIAGRKKKEAPPTKLAAARAKHARQDDEVRKAAENIARRRAEREAAPSTKEEAADVSERPQVPDEAPTSAGEESAQAVEESGAGSSAAAPADGQRDDGADIPLAFFAKVRVTADVFDEETGVTAPEKVPADQALEAVRADIENLTALLKCMKGG
jgi:hypothetical protein